MGGARQTMKASARTVVPAEAEEEESDDEEES
jgi:hypothetical protein